MRIGVLTTGFPRYRGDIAGHFVLGLCLALARRGHCCEVLCPEPAEGDPRADLDGVEVRHVPYLRPRTWQRTFYGAGVPDNLRLDPRAVLGLGPFVGALAASAVRYAPRWDAVISHWALPCGLVAGLLPRRPRHLSILHSADVHALGRLPAGAALAAQSTRGADALWFVSRELRERFVKRLPSATRARASQKSHVCPMGIEPMQTPSTSRKVLRQRLGVRGFTLLTLGRLVPVKGLHVALDALSQLPDVQLVIAGDGPERAHLQRRAAGLARVRFVGTVTGADKHAWLSASDAFLLPSLRLFGGRTEGTPTALLEAMDAGLPVVASDVGGVGEVLEHAQGGYLVPPADSRALVEAVVRLRSTSLRTRMGRHNRRVARRFHWQALAPRAEALLEAPCGDVAANRGKR